jgi:benzylsuccinate CoA-transferase BbsF subunit
MTGIHALTGYEDGTVVGPGTHFPDHAANPGHGLVAVLSALHARHVTGRGTCIELAQVNSTLQLLGPWLLATAVTGQNPVPTGNKVLGALLSGALAAADRYFVLTIMNAGQLQRLSEQLGAGPDLFELSGGPADGGPTNEAGWKLLAEWAGERTAADCVRALQELGIAAAPVEDAETISTRYPELWERGHLVRLPHPEMGDAVYNAPPIRRTDGQEPSLRRAPLLGEHTHEVLKEWLG